MKKFIIITVLIFAGLQIHAQEEKVKWYSFEEAIEMNEKNPRMVLIDVYTDWCGWCKKMKRNTFNHPEIAEYINKNFYAVRFNAETDKEVTFKGKSFVKQGNRSRSPHQLAIALLQGKMSYPSVAYLNEKNQLITAVPGYYGPKDMESILKYFVEEAYKKVSFKDFQKDFKHTLVTE
jgi:thioredoxin-related protein